MQIRFSENCAVNHLTFGVNFEAIVDGSSVICTVSTEALQDIDPNNTSGSAKDKFTAHRSSFERIAERKIRAGERAPIAINSADVRT